MARLAYTLGSAMIALSLAACGGSKQEEASNEDKYGGDEGGGLNLARLVGTTKNPPDEFAVIAKQPLEMPESLVALPAPRPGERSSRTPDPVAEARTALLGSSGTQPANARTSVSESALLNASGASDPNIRAALDADQTNYEEDQSLYILDRYIPSLRRLRGEDDKNIVDPIEERQRLNVAAATPAARAARSGPIATIPGSSTPIPAQVAPAPAQPFPVQTIPRQPAPINPAPGSGLTDGELIYIPE